MLVVSKFSRKVIKYMSHIHMYQTEHDEVDDVQAEVEFACFLIEAFIL